MLKNYIRIAIRNLLKNKSYVIINTFGLGISLACCIAAYMLFAYNLEFDNFHKDEKVGNIYRIHTHTKDKPNTKSETISAPMPLGPVASQELSGIKRFTRFIGRWGSTMRYGDKVFSENISFADSTFFDMFEFPLLHGSHQSFKNKHSIILSKKIASKYFGEENPIGKLVILGFDKGKEVEAIVGGVMNEVPLNSSFVFDVMMRIENYLEIDELDVNSWSDYRDPSTFLELSDQNNAGNLSKQFNKYVQIRNEAKKDVVATLYELQPFKAFVTYDDIQYSFTNTRINASVLITFGSMALIILLIACFNLTNTSIALTANRLKEVGIRKTVGASRIQIVQQFMLETFIIIVLSILVGLLLAQFIVPTFTGMWDSQFTLEDVSGLNLLIVLIIIAFVASFIAGIYPALFYSKLNPVSLLKGKSKVKGTNGLTRTLVALQFALSVIVLIAGVMFIQNAKYQEQLKLGYDHDMVITFNIHGENEFNVIENEIYKNPKILIVGASDHHVGWSSYQFPVEIDTSKYEINLISVGKNYFETMGFTFIEGHSIDTEKASDLNEGVVVNRAFLEKTGLKDPLDKVISIHNVKRHIVGVIENHIDNLWNKEKNSPFAFFATAPSAYRMILVRVESENREEVLKYLEGIWKKVLPHKPFISNSQDDVVFKYTRKNNANMKSIFLFLTILGGLLSSAGIFALASLNTTKRTKEIGIRKALGATITSIINLLNKEFVIILAVAGVIGGIAGYYLIDALLSDSYGIHIPVTITPIILCALFIFSIGIITTSITIRKAAMANPVDTLRDE